MAQLIVVDCRKCGRRMAPPTYACSQCGSNDLTEVSIPGEGELYSHTTIYIPPAGFEKLVPYTVAVVRVAGGLLLSGRLQAAASEIPPLGSRVTLVEGSESCHIFAPV